MSGYSALEANSMEPITQARVFDGRVYGAIPEQAALTRVKAGLQSFIDTVGSTDCLVLAGPFGDEFTGQTTSTEEFVRRACAAHFERFPWKASSHPLHVLLDSQGGSLDSAYRSLLYLRKSASELHVYVPRRAKSASMIVAIGADMLSMSPLAELGPLDTQYKDPRNPDQDFSVLDAYQSVDYVRDFGLATLPMALRALIRDAPRTVQTKAPTAELVGEATRFALGAIEPMLRQVKPLEFGSWGRNLKIGEQYAVSVLKRLGDERANEDVAARIAWQLVYGYTHHPRPIDIAEALSVGLHVTLMDEPLHDAAFEVVDACTQASFVGFMGDVDRVLAEIERQDVANVPRIAQEPEQETLQASTARVVAGRAPGPVPLPDDDGAIG